MFILFGMLELFFFFFFLNGLFPSLFGSIFFIFIFLKILLLRHRGE